MSLKIRSTSSLVATLLLIATAFALRGDGGSKLVDSMSTASLTESETNYLQNETDMVWENSGKRKIWMKKKRSQRF